MSHTPKGFSPKAASQRGGASPSGSANPLWWVVAGIAVLVSVSLVVWLVVTSGDPVGGSTEPVSTSAGPSAGPTVVDPWEPGGVDWGDFPPINLDSLPDLSDPVLPKTVGTYSFVKERRDTYSVVGDYEDDESFGTMSANIDFTASSYALAVNNLAEPAYLGRAVCGVSTGGAGRNIVCVMAGKNETVRVGTADDGSTVEQVAAFANEIYDLF